MPPTVPIASGILLVFGVCASLAAQAGSVPAAPPAAAPEPDPAAQPQDPQAPGGPPPVIVTATRTEEDPFQAPWSTAIVDEDRIRERGYRTTPQVLREIPSVLLQETSPGQGSPFIRGFTGYSNLFLIDGVRLNNSVFRSGPNQYWSTVDVLSLERLEVLKGPAGAQYGSDAVGGTVQAVTRNPYVHAEDGLVHGGRSYARYATAEDSVWGRGEFSIGQRWADGARTGFLLGADARSFGDLEGGRSTGTQPGTGYRETAADFKLEHFFDRDTRLVLLHQQVSQDEVPRTHATIQGISYAGTAVGTDLQRNLFQDRSLTYLQYHREGLEGPFQQLHFNLSWHQQSEDEDRIRGNGTRDVQGFDARTLGTFLQLHSDAGELGRLTYGVDYYRDFVDSYKRSSSPQPGDAIQGPVGDNACYDLLGVFLQDVVPLGDAAELVLGGRWTYARADADKVRDPATSTRIAVHDQWDQLTGSVRLRVDLLEDRWQVFGGASQGFRAPNLSDLTSAGVARSGEVEIAVPGLSPEHYLGYEVGTKVQGDRLAVQAAWFHTDIEDQILRYPTGAVDPGSGLPIVTKANVGDGYVQGVELEGSWVALADTTLFGAFTWQYGRVWNFDAGGATRTREYISRLMPVTTMVGARWEDPDARVYVETLVLRAEDADRLSAGDQRDTQRIPPGGTPGYTTWNLHAGWRIGDRATLDAGIDNLTDVDHRVHGSGSNAPGRSLLLGLTVTF